MIQRTSLYYGVENEVTLLVNWGWDPTYEGWKGSILQSCYDILFGSAEEFEWCPGIQKFWPS